ncbi:N-acetylglucosamine kinase [Krasilnikovia sp. MM14-A1259]|uniref:N-acetylglucosamine kinase n=1 Tax=Krasilnikovia sp. MM14-A1259 TaxID=3373539 RepID=UPI00382C6C60
MPGSASRQERLVLGLDVGGTWTRALLATTAGRRIGVGRAAGANPSAYGVTVAAQRIASAVGAALRTSDPSAVEACVVGLAGASQYASDPDTVRGFERIWTAAGLTCPVRVTSDVTVAFAAGSPEPEGSVLIAGTGAVAARIRDREPVAVHGGHGWLLGDDGSGYWIGRQAVRSALSALDGRAPMSALPELIVGWYLAGSAAGLSPATRRSAGHPGPAPVAGHGMPSGDPHAADAAAHSSARESLATLIREVNRRPPTTLAELAPLVMQAHGTGDTAAESIVREAADLLMADLEQVATSGTPVVLAGGLLASAGPVRDLVVSAILARWPDVDVCTARDGPAAAAWLAALPLLAGDAKARALHARMVSRAR